MFENESLPGSFNKIVEISDNYIVWSNQSVLYSGVDYEVYIQFLNPSFGLLHITDYRITKGDSYTLDYNFNQLGGISSAELDYSLQTMSSYSGFENNEYMRSDFPQIFICGFISCVVFYWVFHKLSYLFHKGGI